MSPDTAPYQFKQGDTAPPLIIGLEYADGTQVLAASLATAESIMLYMQDVDTDAVVSGSMVHVTSDADYPEDNAVRYDWTAGDTDTAGLYTAEIVVVFADSKEMSFPNDGRFLIEIHPRVA